MSVSAVPSDEELRGQLAETLREHRWLVEELAPLSDRDGYLPGAPCMDCGSYPGPIHDRRSDCPRVLAKVLLPVVRRYADQRAAEELRKTTHAWQWGAWGDTPRHADPVVDRIGAAQYVTEWLRARADALAREATT